MARTTRGGRTWARGPNALSASYRARLVGAGITRADWLAGADLRTARSQPGYRPNVPAERARRPAGAAPKTATDRLLAGDATPSDIAAIEAWRRPAWLPDRADMSDDTAAAISQIDLQPRNWGKVEFFAQPDGANWRMVVTPKSQIDKRSGKVKSHAYDRQIVIPGGGAKDTVGASEVLEWLSKADGAPVEKFDITGTDPKVRTRTYRRRPSGRANKRAPKGR